MSYRESLPTPLGGRGSPYPVNGLSERSLSDMYEYVPGDDNRGLRGDYHEQPMEDDNAPDVVNIRYMGSTFRVEFPPFAISESGAFVDELRVHVARKLNQDPRRIRLVYKHTEMNNDSLPLKSYGCKQNSEVNVVLTDSLNDYSPTTTHFREEEPAGLRPPASYENRQRANSSVRTRYIDEDRYASSQNPSGRLHPDSSYNHYPDRRTSTARRPPSREPSPTAPRPSAIQVPPSPRRPPRRNVDPSSPMGKVQALQDQFYDRWEPESNRFLSSPPSESEARRKEYVRLSESVMRHIIEAADAIEVGDDKDARVARKAVLNAAQELLKQLDAANSR